MCIVLVKPNAHLQPRQCTRVLEHQLAKQIHHHNHSRRSTSVFLSILLLFKLEKHLHLFFVNCNVSFEKEDKYNPVNLEENGIIDTPKMKDKYDMHSTYLAYVLSIFLCMLGHQGRKCFPPGSYPWWRSEHSLLCSP